MPDQPDAPVPPEPASDGGGLPAGIERRLTRVERRLAAVTDALDRLAPAVDSVRSLVANELSTLSTDVLRTAALVDSFSASLDATTETVPDRIDRAVATLASWQPEVPDVAADLRSTLESALAAQASRIEATLATARREIAAAIDAIPVGPDPDVLQAAVTAAVRAELAESTADTRRQVQAVVAEIRDELGATTDQVTTRLAALTSLVDDTRTQVVDQVGRTRDLTADRLDHAVRESAELAATMQAQITAGMAAGDDQSEALQAAVRGTQAPVETLTGAVEALDALVHQTRDEAAEDRGRLADLREQVAVLVASVRQGLAELQDAMSAHEATVDAQVAAFREGFAEDVAAFREDVAAVNQEVAAAFVDRTHQAGQTFALEAAASMDEIAIAVESVGSETVRRIREADQSTATELATARDRLADAVEALVGVEQSVRERLDAVEQHAATERAELAARFAEQLADGLRGRERRRLARALEDPGPAPETSSAGPSPSREPAVPEPAEPAAAPASPDPETGPTDDAAATAEAAMTEDLPPAWDDPDTARRPPSTVVRRRPAGKPSTASTPGPTTSTRRAAATPPPEVDPTDPTMTRSVLATVPGLGPVKQSALIDRFGTIAAIRAASDDEVLAVDGIGPALLGPIRDIVG